MTATGQEGDRRRRPRRRLRLHAARVVDCDGRHLGDGALGDASDGGVRLRLREAVALPDHLMIFDEGGRRVAAARVVWARGREAGLTLGDWRPLDEAPAALRRRLAGAYYATD